MNDDAVEAVIDEGNEVAEQLGEQVHGKLRETRSWPDRIKRGAGQQLVEGGNFRLADEVRYIQPRAANRDGRVVSFGELLLFSTNTGDAWLLDRSDRLATRLARDGEVEPVHIEETDTSLIIGWKSRYRITGQAFVYSDRESGRSSPSSGIQRIRSPERYRKISNMFG